MPFYGRVVKLGPLLLFLLLLPLLTGLPGGTAAAQATGGYRIGTGDDISISVWRQSDLSTTATVRPDGRITIPLVEDIEAAGKEPEALAREIEEILSEFVLDPQVTVTVNSRCR